MALHRVYCQVTLELGRCFWLTGLYARNPNRS